MMICNIYEPGRTNEPYQVDITMPIPFVRPSLNTKRVPGVRYSGRCKNRKRTHAPAESVRDVYMRLLAFVGSKTSIFQDGMKRNQEHFRECSEGHQKLTVPAA